MLKINFSATEISADDTVKTSAATKQMRDLLARLANGLKYRMLTNKDRATLMGEGYAADLVNNLVFITQRIPGHNGMNARLEDQSWLDQVVAGFTDSAIDPSIYASKTITNHLRQLSDGRCCFCESPLVLNGAEQVVHLRPASILVEKGTTYRSPYFELAYQQQNLYYACPKCAQHHQGPTFPVSGSRYPTVSLAQENRLLVDPYQDQPRDYIRFNPINGEAYAFDAVSQFLIEQGGQTADSCQNWLWAHPERIPVANTDLLSQIDSGNNQNHLQPNQQADYQQWRQRQNKVFRGEQTIASFGLNRVELIRSRQKQNVALYREYLADKNDRGWSGIVSLNEVQQDFSDYHYQSLALDCLNSWLKTENLQSQLLSADSNPESTQSSANLPIDWSTVYFKKKNADPSNTVSLPSSDNNAAQPTNNNAVTPLKSATANAPEPHHWPQWFLSSLIYVVFESELTLKNKRRIVSLNAKDKLYGGDLVEKCVFQSIDWQKDSQNVIKVRSARNTWETSFLELSASRPMEIFELFANNEIWAEGDYPAFAQS